MSQSSNSPLTVVFMGTPQFSVPCLQTLLDSPHINLLAVLTQPDKPAGRGQQLSPPPIKVLAESANFPVHQPTKLRTDDALIAHLAELKPDFLVTIAFGQILPQAVLDVPKYGTVNVHASLLPKYRGANPIQQAIRQGEAETGLTTMLTELGVDTGPMLLTHIEPISPTDTTIDLHDRMSAAAGDLLVNSLVGLANGEITPQPQDDALATHAPKLTKADAQLDWTQPAAVVDRHIRGQQPWPGTVTTVNDQPLKVLQSSCEASLGQESKENTQPGLVNSQGDLLTVTCGDGQAITLHTVQPAGKKAMAAGAWFNGLQKPSDLVLGQ